MVDFDDDLGELGVAAGERQRLPGGIDARVARRRLAPPTCVDMVPAGRAD